MSVSLQMLEILLKHLHSVCLSLYFNIRMFVCLLNSCDFHESCTQLLLFYYWSTRWPRDAHVEEFTAEFHVIRSDFKLTDHLYITEQTEDAGK